MACSRLLPFGWPLREDQDLARRTAAPGEVVEALRRPLPADPAVDQRPDPVRDGAHPGCGLGELGRAVGERTDQAPLPRADRVRGQVQLRRSHADQHDPAAEGRSGQGVGDRPGHAHRVDHQGRGAAQRGGDRAGQVTGRRVDHLRAEPGAQLTPRRAHIGEGQVLDPQPPGGEQARLPDRPAADDQHPVLRGDRRRDGRSDSPPPAAPPAPPARRASPPAG